VPGARDLTRRELALLRELLPWRDALARELDKSTFRVVSNDVLLEISRQAPVGREALAAIKGMPRGIIERNGEEILELVRRGMAVADAELPRFPRAPRWDRDPDFDARVARLKGVRDEAAQRLELDPGVLCSRERMEAVARRRPATMEELLAMTELRRWQCEVLGPGFLQALAQGDDAPPAPKPPRAASSKAPAAPTRAADDSPYREG
jgi:ribonuclease D